MIGMQEVDAGEVVNNMHPGHHAFFLRFFLYSHSRERGRKTEKEGGKPIDVRETLISCLLLAPHLWMQPSQDDAPSYGATAAWISTMHFKSTISFIP